MVSSIYPLTVSLNPTGTLSSVAIVAGGTGYSVGETLTITGSTSGSSDATATVTTVTPNAIVSVDVIDGGSGWTNGETVSLTGFDSGETNATASIFVVGGVIQSFTIISGGTLYEDGEFLTVVGTGSSGIGVANAPSVIITVSVALPGTNYTDAETVTLTGTGTGATGTATTAGISADSDILSSDLSITSDQLRPSGGGTVRLAFAFSFDTSPATISVFNGGVFKGNLNADNSTNIITDGYYRFDIDVESGDTINLQSSQIINAVNFLRAHLVLVGA